MIKRIKIENFKSIESFSINSDNEDIICLIGKNGSGKSNVFKAIKYFFDHINKPFSEEHVIDKSNPYIQKCKISITFNLKILKEKSKHNSELKKRFNLIDNFIEEQTGILRQLFEKNHYDIELVMVQNKDGLIKWNIDNKIICETIRTLFPIYYIDTRRLDIFTWDHLWRIISDLSAAMPQKSDDEFREILDDAFTKVYGEKYTVSKQRIENAFEINKISLDPYHFKSRYKNAFSMRFGGEFFLVDNQPLSYFSDGSNSYKYLILLSTLIPQISEISCKFPVILLDEPEIGLHSKYITDLIKSISKNICNNTLMFISTHSAKLLSDLIVVGKTFQLYKIVNIGSHSKLSRMNTAWLTDSKHKPTVKETECFFYDYLVYVEGETEIELFNNERIKHLFPKLDNIHFYSFDGNHERLNTVSAKNLNLGVPYKLIIDMDQIINYSDKTKKFKLTSKDVNPLKKKKKKTSTLYRYYKPDSINLFSLKEQINELLDNAYASIENIYIDDYRFNLMMCQIQRYCSFFNTIVNWSTIEGELITYENINKFMSFVSTQTINNRDQHNEIIRSISDNKKKTILIMCEYCGKTELFTPKKDSKLQYDTNKKLDKVVSSKTSGWVSSWMNYYFDQFIEPLESEDDKLQQFEKDFPSLFNTLQQFENMVE